MSLPLMPGSEPMPEKAPAPTTITRDNIPRAQAGCGCAMCRNSRAQEIASGYAALEQYEAARPVPPPVFNWDEATPVFAPPPVNAGRIRGRYDFTHLRSGLHGQVRWREPGTMEVYDEEGRRQWTYTRELPGGILEDNSNHRWVPTEV